MEKLIQFVADISECTGVELYVKESEGRPYLYSYGNPVVCLSGCNYANRCLLILKYLEEQGELN